MQHLATLGYEHFNRWIEFINVLLSNGRNNYKKYQRVKAKNKQLIEASKRYGNSINRKHNQQHDSDSELNYTSEYRLNKKIDTNIAQHASHANRSTNNVLDSYISYKYRTNPSIFIHNRELAHAKQKEFDRKQKELWNDFKNNQQRITNLTLNYANRRQSFRDIQCHRQAVKFVSQ